MDGKKKHRTIYEERIREYYVTVLYSIVFLVFHIYIIQVILSYMEIV